MEVSKESVERAVALLAPAGENDYARQLREAWRQVEIFPTMRHCQEIAIQATAVKAVAELLEDQKNIIGLLEKMVSPQRCSVSKTGLTGIARDYCHTHFNGGPCPVGQVQQWLLDHGSEAMKIVAENWKKTE